MIKMLRGPAGPGNPAPAHLPSPVLGPAAHRPWIRGAQLHRLPPGQNRRPPRRGRQGHPRQRDPAADAQDRRQPRRPADWRIQV